MVKARTRKRKLRRDPVKLFTDILKRHNKSGDFSVEYSDSIFEGKGYLHVRGDVDPQAVWTATLLSMPLTTQTFITLNGKKVDIDEILQL